MNLFEEKLTTEELKNVYGGNDPVEDDSTDVDYDDAQGEMP